MARSGQVVIASFISPYAADRDKVRERAGDLYHEIYVKADIETCEARDETGIYKKARAGKVKSFTGLDPDAPYDVPSNPELIIDTQRNGIDFCVEQLVHYIEQQIALGDLAADSHTKEQILDYVV